MTAQPTIARMKTLENYLKPYLKNAGSSPLKRGTLYVRQKSTDNTVKDRSFWNGTELNPGETTQLIEEFVNANQIDFVQYIDQQGVAFSLNCVAMRGWFGWSLK